jgi:hypothetical protein
MQLAIAAMNNHPDDADLHLYACEFLRRLAKAHEDYRGLMLQAKGLGPIGNALWVHKNNAPVKLAARKAFKVISA